MKKVPLVAGRFEEHATSPSPEAPELRKHLDQWGANRSKDAEDATRDGELPRYVLRQNVLYEEKTLGPGVEIPFRHKPSIEEVRAVAENVARFMSQHTGKPHEIEDISQVNYLNGVTEYFVKRKPRSGEPPSLISPCYRVSRGLSPGVKVVTVRPESSREHDRNALQVYAQSIILALA